MSVDLPCVDFGLVAVGAACSRSLCVTNRSPANVTVHMTQVVVGRQESVVDYNTATQCVDEWQIPVTVSVCVCVCVCLNVHVHVYPSECDCNPVSEHV